MAIGYQSLWFNGTGSDNTAIGTLALATNSSGINNAATGESALGANTIGGGNTAIGMRALSSNAAGSNATAIGYDAMRYANDQAGAFTNYNVAVGYEALRGSTTASANTGNWNTSCGYQALRSNTSGGFNTATGYQALYMNADGVENTAHGYLAMYSNTSGAENTAFGWRALYSNGTGNFNTADGFNTLQANTSGVDNTAIGYGALTFNNIGTRNTAVGRNALGSITTESYNTAVGYYANLGGSTSNSTALGANSVMSASNKVRLGDATVTVIEGQVAYTFPSDGRFKNNVTEEVKGIAFINKLRPVIYNFDTRKFDSFLMKTMPDSLREDIMRRKDYTESTSIRQSGFIAQEVELAAQESGYVFNGVHKPTSENDNYSVAYALFVVPLVKAMQEQQQMIESMHSVANDQQKEISELKAIVEKLVRKDKAESEKNK